MEKLNQSGSVPEKTNSYHNELMRYHHASKHDYQPGSQEEQRLRDWERSYEAREQKIKQYRESTDDDSSPERIDDAIELIKDVLQRVDAVVLDPVYADDEVQIALLRTKKRQVKDLVQNLLQKDVLEYVSCVREFNKARVDVQQQNIGVDTFAEYDERRTRKHNVLIDSIHIVSRFIKNNFGELTDEEQDVYEEFLESRGEPYVNVQRISLPKNVICPDYIDLTKREEITDWALDISRSLAELPF